MYRYCRVHFCTKTLEKVASSLIRGIEVVVWVTMNWCQKRPIHYQLAPGSDNTEEFFGGKPGPRDML